MIGPKQVAAANDQFGRISAGVSRDAQSAWAGIFGALGLDAETMAAFIATHDIYCASSGTAWISGFALGVIAGRRDAAECMEIPA